MSSGDPALPTEPSRWSADELVPFGKYILLNKMSSGATAAVYRAKIRGEAGFERLLTIKRILPQMAGDPEFVDTFVREAKICARLSHSNICPIYELGKVGESLYIAMEWVAGKDLGAIARRLEYTGRVMPPLIAAWIAGRLCDALDYAHALKDAEGEPMGIVHQDLSPTNIVVSYEGQVKLIDFGLAKAAGRAQQTNVDALKQKIGYMSPELILGNPLDARSDVFGVGVCLYEMVTGRRLFAGTNDIATLKLVSSATVPPPSALIEDTPDELEMIMMRALERDPDKRWRTAGEMGQAIAACIAGDDPTFGTRHITDFMKELFAQDMVVEQRRLNELLAASQDPEVIEQRRRMLASPMGAAAIAKAEAARRMVSTLPPPARAKPAANGGGSPAPTDGESAVPADLHNLKTKNLGGLLEETSNDELTTFRPEGRPKRTTGAHKAMPTAPAATADHAAPHNPDEEPTTFRPDAPHGSDDDATTFRPDGRSEANRPATTLPPVMPPDLPPHRGEEERTHDLAQKAAAAQAGAQTFEDEATSYFDAQSRASKTHDAPPAGPKSPIGFEEEEATHIFFTQDDAIDTPPPPQPPRVGRPITAPMRRATPSQVRDKHAPAAAPALTQPQDTGAPAWPTIRGGVDRGPTLETTVPQRNERAPLLWLGLAMLVLTVAGLIVKTPLGITLGLRDPTEGAIEVRTVPPIAAAVRLDGIYRGRAPLRLEGVRTGVRMLALEADGYVTVARHVTVEGGGTSSVNITLEAQPPAVPVQPTP